MLGDDIIATLDVTNRRGLGNWVLTITGGFFFVAIVFVFGAAVAAPKDDNTSH